MSARKNKGEVFQSTRGKKEWYWRVLSSNKRIIGVSGEGFKTKGSAKNSLSRMLKAASDIEVTVLETPKKKKASAKKNGAPRKAPPSAKRKRTKKAAKPTRSKRTQAPAAA